MSTDEQRIAYPGDNHQLDWNWGENLQLDLTWASNSVWRPSAATLPGQYQVDGATASFPIQGQWGFLRWVFAHHPSVVPDVSPTDSNASVLEFAVPLTDKAFDKGEARVYLTVKVGAVDGKGQAGEPIPLPRAWPRAAPLYR